MKQRNKNKGFSLVELIVVVLIMGIIAISLAPQVMKWVGTARKNTDARVTDNLKSVGQMAVVEYESEGGTLVDAEYLVTSTGVSPVTTPDPNSGMVALLVEYMDKDYPKVQNESGKIFQIKIEDTGVVTVSTVSGTY